MKNFSRVLLFGVAASVSGATACATHGTNRVPSAEMKRVNLNTATLQELEKLPGITSETAANIISARPFERVGDLSKVKGVDAETALELNDRVSVGKPRETVASEPNSGKNEPTVRENVNKAAASATESAMTLGEKIGQKTKEAARAAAAGVKKGVKTVVPGEKTSLNDASEEQIQRLPGVTPKIADAIINGRPYSKIEDLKKTKGITQSTYEDIKDSVSL